MSILIGADLVPSANNSNLFASGDIKSLLGKELISILNSVDYRVFNLETPLTDCVNQIAKAGPALRADKETIAGIKKIGVDLFTLANNHIMDYGEKGLKSTIDTLDKNNISYLGVGNNLFDAQKPWIVDIKEKKIGFYACAEHEFSIAGKNTPGANPFDPLETFDHVVSLREQCDYLIVLYHGGKEHYRYPSPMLQRICRKFAEKGANLVVCQHSHCIGCEEKYGCGTIVYGQGNFIFSDCNGLTEQTSVLIKLNDDFSVEYLPLMKVENGVRLAVGENAEKILSEYRNRSKQILEDDFIDNEYHKFAEKKFNGYMLYCSGYYHNFLLRLINKITGHRLSNFFGIGRYSLQELISLCNFIECEAHRELWLNGLHKGVSNGKKSY